MSIGLLISAASYLLIGPIPLLHPLLGPQMYWLVWVALGGVGIGAGMTFVPSLPALLHAAHTLVRPLLDSVSTSEPAPYRNHRLFSSVRHMKWLPKLSFLMESHHWGHI